MKRFGLFFLVLLSVGSIVSGQPVVVVVRHAEKAATAGQDPDLSPAGRARAAALARILQDAGITEIFATEFKRTQETAAPTAKALGIRPTIVSSKNAPALIAKLRELTGNALVVGHGDTIPNLLKSLGIDLPINIRDGDYTDFFVVTLGDRPQLFRLHYPS